MSYLLLVEDEPSIQTLLAMNLKREGYETKAALTAGEAVSAVDGVLPSLVLLDWMLPDRSGIELLQHWRSDRRTSELPILMLTARSEEEDVVRALQAGADDYVTKPFSIKELMARVHSLLRRARPDATQSAVTVGTLRIEPAQMQAFSKDVAIKLSPLEFRLLHFLIKSQDVVHTRAALLDAVWGDHVYIEERTVDVHIKRLRATLAPHSLDELIETVRGGGYMIRRRSAV